MPSHLPGHVPLVLVVDDSVVVRQMVARALDDDDDLELAGVAPNGRVAMERVAELSPDVIVLDLEMPVMDGFEVLAELRRTRPDIPVVVFSQLTDRGAAATLEALAMGAAAFVRKPAASGAGGNTVRTELLPLVKAVAGKRRNDAEGRLRTSPRGAVSAVVIAASTGGPSALALVLSALPADLAAPVLVVQHMPSTFLTLFAARLDAQCALRVREATTDEPIVAGTAYLAPGGRHMAVRRVGGEVRIVLHDGPPVNSCRPAADILFRAAADVYGPAVLGVVLTGMGHDGLEGSEAIATSGGSVVVESRTTAVVGSMPGGVADAGFAAAIVRIEKVAAEIVRRTGTGA